MGLRCLLGHDFTEPEIEKEREEDGREVVTTVREVKTCSRCGETQVVSENTEVTTIEQLADHAAGDEGTNRGATGTASGTGAVAETGTAAAGDVGDAGDAGNAIDATGSGGIAAGDGVDVSKTPDLDRTADDVASGVKDDAVILDDDPGPTDPDPTDEAPTDEGPTDPADAAESASSVDAAGSASEQATDPASGAAVGSDSASAADSASDLAADDEDAELIDSNGSDDTARTAATETGSTAAADDQSDAAGSEATTSGETTAEDDDGVILDDDTTVDDGDRAHGAWPADDAETDDGSTGSGDHTPWPEQRGEDEGFSAEVGGSGDADVEFGGGLTPEPADPTAESDPDTEYVEAPDDGIATGTGSGASTASDDRSSRDIDADADGTSPDAGSGIAHGDSPDFERPEAPVASEYYCPACGMTREIDGNSLRPGDICPDCKRGYIDERPI